MKQNTRFFAVLRAHGFRRHYSANVMNLIAHAGTSSDIKNKQSFILEYRVWFDVQPGRITSSQKYSIFWHYVYNFYKK